MSKKRAIEAAVKANRMPPIPGIRPIPTYDTYGIADQAFEAGRIAGLREAARIAVSVYVDYDFYGREEAKLIEDGQDGAAKAIRKHARELAKKARKP